ncbi:Ltp family lipoprotein [Micrococcus sp. TA1]|uniref:Ltp family lipoprotein n=1 Tax=Micrococcus sp. TA1 TaxID=681627 RepID=UPI0016080E94|nr:Ltp family lipoprotein [Micrococcus sp. TA1]MBB5750148.1 flagellar biosynthesis GTPase FlhF [Micrococcus sp. TA1]
MTGNQSFPSGTSPHDPVVTSPYTDQAAKKSARPWYRKKRFILPTGVLALFVAAGIAGGGGDVPETEAAPQGTSVASPSTAQPTADIGAEASARAERKAQESAQAEAEAEAAKKADAEAKAEADAQASQEAEAKAEAEAEAEAQAAEEAAAGTVSQQNALRSAENYLDFTAFSRPGLIDQLEFEGYSTADATWAVDRLTVDWKEQAVKSAANYLDFTSFSRQGLIDQLVFEGFTAEQATYGVDQTGL